MHPDAATLHDEVAALAPVDERMQTAKQRFLDELRRLPDPFDERADPVHVTASGIVLGSRGVLLLRHKRLGLWMQPGGHIDPGESPAQAAVRETREETGLPVTHPPDGPQLVHLDVHPGGRGHIHLDLRYLLRAPPWDPRPPVGESQDVEWCSWDQAVERADPGLSGALLALHPARA